METLVDEVWVVDAPKDIRVARVMVRNNMPEEDVRKRIDSQNDNPKFSVPTSVVENYGSNSVIVQVQNLLKTMWVYFQNSFITLCCFSDNMMIH